MGTSITLRDYPRRTLRGRQFQTLVAMASVLFEDLSRPECEELVSRADRMMSQASKTLRFSLLIMLVLLELLPLLILRTPRLFCSLPRDAATEYLKRLEHSRVFPLPLLFVAFKTLLVMLEYERPERLRTLGYTGPGRTRYERTVGARS